MGTSPWPVRNWDGGHTAGGEQKAREWRFICCSPSLAWPPEPHDTSHPPTLGSVEKLLFMKPVPGAKMVGDHSYIVLYCDSSLPGKGPLSTFFRQLGERSNFLEPFGFSCEIIHMPHPHFEEANCSPTLAPWCSLPYVTKVEALWALVSWGPSQSPEKRTRYESI